jgi:ParB-like chromosome segregation protein Spo0J
MKAFLVSEGYPIREIALGSIRDDLHRLRELRPDKVEELAESMNEHGLINPITVRPLEEIGYYLVAGRHRFRAAKTLKWRSIMCQVRDDLDDDAAEIIQIDENLRRADLRADERQEHLLRWKEIWERRQEENRVAQNAPVEIGYKKPPPAKKGFAAEAAAITGRSKSQINRDLAASKPKAEPTPRRSKEEVVAEKALLESERRLSSISGFADFCHEFPPEVIASGIPVFLKADHIAGLREDVRTIHKWLDAFMAEINRKDPVQLIRKGQEVVATEEVNATP